MKKTLHADFVRVGYCGECDGLHMQLHDETGAVIAIAVLDKEQAEQIGKECALFVEHGAAARAVDFAKDSGRLQ